jgi:hypothetical protein
MSKDEAISLLVAKASVLLHNSPHKAWVLADHESEAKRLRNGSRGTLLHSIAGSGVCGRMRLEG